MNLAQDRVVSDADKVSNVLKWILLITAITCFAGLIWGTYKTYQLAPPLPQQFLTSSAKVVMTSDDIIAGKAGFQRADLMDYGSLYGMGSYFGEDYTAKYLVRLGQLTEEEIGQQRFGQSFINLSEEEQYISRKTMQQALQQINLSQQTTVLPDPVATAIFKLQSEISQSLLNHNLETGWTKAYSLDAQSALQTADFLIYSSLTTVAHRPHQNSSYTNNWPYEPTVGNNPTSSTFYWTWVSFCFVFFGFGAILYIYHRYLAIPDNAAKTPILLEFKPLTASQRKVGQYFVIVALVLLAQIGVGAIMAHYYTERTGFYGININGFLPFNFLRDVHIQTPIVWIALSWISSAVFLAPIISKQEAKGQGFLVDLLFWVTLFIVGGAIVGNYLGIMGYVNQSWFWIGNQGLSYIQLGRLWQIGFCLGLFLWSFIVFRGMWPTWEQLKTATAEFWTGRIRLEHMLWASTINVAVLYCFGMIPLTGIEKSFTITDFWRWWVVHLWVEQSFEFFAAAATAYLLMGTGLVSRLLAERTMYFETILIFLGGVIGTGHHWYWTGTPDIWVPLGSMFSFIEVLPLVLLIIDAIEHHQLIKRQGSFTYNLACLYLFGAAFWNFVGAGVFGGGTLNAPLVNYYEHGTFLTLNHAHTALFGAFGLLGLGLIYFCLRYAAGERLPWDERLGIWAFWLYNIGLLLWIVLNFFPVGWAQLMDVYEHGLAHARSLEFYNTTLLWQWLRLPGDVIFALGALLMTYDFFKKLKPFFPRLAKMNREQEIQFRSFDKNANLQ
ncbi:nitric-oxide reductase large subunit [Legionella micdadei]|uniref:Nitric oxide reductase, NorZ apoprotein n=1 Tax=Legionella micdadei TaxID=451 RepID=A0A098GFZ8_LEGMI|nr:cbb3-type cytochrome c oxidase subunit I [Legionella micdadei]ARG97532.1 nitric oxide reductase [Legionella micdadei]KTD27605.1 nitric oxide reductase [Legionella micdadei]NSL17587.1 cbb3-type cytochrome c oxidase subunit I [Legionella micdadei]CEG60910.1 putative nitric oxide reductase subunit B [Legionella micdadei]SCY16926.1 nitric oxide reductase, NorZ apoprotein [Legionella micdadei]